jgi:hypothetical protein
MQHGSAEQVECARVRRLFQILILSAPLVGEDGESSGVKNLELLQRVVSPEFVVSSALELRS